MRIEDVCTVFTDGDWIESKDQSEEGIRLVQTGNIGEGIYLEKEERAKYISEDTFERLKCTEIFPGDILVSRLPEPVGRACIVPDKSERMITAVDCTVCRPDEMIISKEYLCYFMRSNAYYTRLLGNVAGTTRKRISRKNLGNIELNVPTKDEQRAVVKQLNCLTKIIDSKNKEIYLLDELIKARFIEMFGQGSYPRHALIELITEGAGLSYGIVQPGDDGTGDMGVLRPVDLVDGEISTAAIKYIDRSIGDGFKKTELTGDELLITVRGTTGITALTDVRFKNMNVTRGIAVIRYDRSKINPAYLNAYLNTDESQRYIREHTRGATLQQINLADLRTLEILMPSRILQEKFATFVAQVDKSKFLRKVLLNKKRDIHDT